MTDKDLDEDDEVTFVLEVLDLRKCFFVYLFRTHQESRTSGFNYLRLDSGNRFHKLENCDSQLSHIEHLIKINSGYNLFFPT